MNKIYINGKYFDSESAKISVLDRGFLFSDGIYEVIPKVGPDWVGFDEHLSRMQQSCKELHIDQPEENWSEVAEQLLHDEGYDNDQSCFIYIQVTRGQMPMRNHVYSEITPNRVAWLQPMSVPSKSEVAKGVKAIFQEDLRWGRCDIKSISLLGNIIAKNAAVKAGAEEALLVKGDFVLEGSSCNLFIVRSGTVFTHPLSRQILPGVTRRLLVEVLNEQSIPLVEEPFTQTEVLKADEVWLTSSTKGVIPVTQVDQKKIGDGESGDLWSKVYDEFQKKYLSEV
ncbi:MAG: aminotransferase class IV [Bdellovibrionales bacterium]|nr:aminotransferase class IV [Bdellovibrionales bacterium]